ncbi:hypothetical protein [Halovivax sp.]|nr:hypothetical protein [Halovivax sp.]
MVLDRRAAERRRFARLLGLTDDGRGLPVGLATDQVDDADGAGPH